MGSLRWAILSANNVSAPSTIVTIGFASQLATIALTAQLPPLLRPYTVLDAGYRIAANGSRDTSSQAGHTMTLVMETEDNLLGLTLAAAHLAVKGLRVYSDPSRGAALGSVCVYVNAAAARLTNIVTAGCGYGIYTSVASRRLQLSHYTAYNHAFTSLLLQGAASRAHDCHIADSGDKGLHVVSVQGCDLTDIAIRNSSTTGLLVASATNVRVRNLVVTHSGADGLLLVLCQDCLVEQAQLLFNGREGGYLANCHDVDLRNLWAAGNAADGLFLLTSTLISVANVTLGAPLDPAAALSSDTLLLWANGADGLVAREVSNATIGQAEFCSLPSLSSASRFRHFAASVNAWMPAPSNTSTTSTTMAATAPTIPTSSPPAAAADRLSIISNNRASGLYIVASQHVHICGVLIGVDRDGATQLPNGEGGMYLQTASDVLIAGNLVSGNRGDGIVLQSTSDSWLRANLVGLDAFGQSAGNRRHGLYLLQGANSNLVGGSGLADSNFVAGQGDTGVVVFDSSFNTVSANVLGLSWDGTSSRGNTQAGIQLVSANHNFLTNNVVAASRVHGVILDRASNATIRRNWIGVAPSLTAIHSLPRQTVLAVLQGNAGVGILVLSGSTANVIGGLDAEAGNVVGKSGGPGIQVEAALDTVIGHNLVGWGPAGSGSAGNAANGISLLNVAGAGTVITHNIVQNNSNDGIVLSNCQSMQLRQNTVVGQRLGIVLDRSSGCLIDDNTVQRQTFDGIYLTASSGNLLRGNRLGTDTQGSKGLGNGRYGVHLLLNSDNCTLLGNVAVSSGQHGLVALQSSNLHLLNNSLGYDPLSRKLLPNSGDGTDLVSCTNATVEDNLFAGNGDAGLYVQTCTTVRVLGNLFGGSWRWANSNYGLYASSSDDLVLQSNVAAGQSGRGVQLEQCSAAVIQYNIFGGPVLGPAPNAMAMPLVDSQSPPLPTWHSQLTRTYASWWYALAPKDASSATSWQANNISGLTLTACSAVNCTANLFASNGLSALQLAYTTDSLVQDNVFDGWPAAGGAAQQTGPLPGQGFLNSAISVEDRSQHVLLSGNVVVSSAGSAVTLSTNAQNCTLHSNYLGLWPMVAAASGTQPLNSSMLQRWSNWGANIVLNQARHSVVRGNIIVNSRSHGVQIGPGSSEISLLGNFIGVYPAAEGSSSASTPFSGSSTIMASSGTVSTAAATTTNSILPNSTSSSTTMTTSTAAASTTFSQTTNANIPTGQPYRAAGNLGAGVAVSNFVTSLAIGGLHMADNEGNIIAFNGGAGLQLFTPGPLVFSNAVYNNSGGGLVLTGCDTAACSPVAVQLLQASESGVVTGLLLSPQSQALILQIFASAQCDGSGRGQGQVLLISNLTVNVEAGQPTTFAVTMAASHMATAAALSAAPVFTATATALSMGTFPFSGCVVQGQVYTACSACQCTGTVVNCRNQGLLVVPPQWPPHAQILDFRDNPSLTYADWPANLSAVVPRLTILLLAKANIDSQRVFTSFQKHPRLMVLDVSGNHQLNNLANFDTASLPPSLAELFLNGLQISALPSDFLQGIPSLQRLSLEHNDLSVISRHSFGNSSVLLQLSLAYNPLSRIEDESFAGLISLQTLDLRRQVATASLAVSATLFKGLRQLAAVQWAEVRSCPAGYAPGFVGENQLCFRCPPGTFSTAAASSLLDCTACPAGSVDEDSDAVTPCQRCGNGTYVPARSIGACTTYRCPAGTADNDTDPATPCIACLIGTFAPVGSAGPAACRTCVSTEQTDHDRDPATPCISCPATTLPALGIGSCLPLAVSMSDNSDEAADFATALSTGLIFGLLSLCLLVLVVVLRRRAQVAQRKHLAEIRALHEQAQEEFEQIAGLQDEALNAHFEALQLRPDELEEIRILGEGEFGSVHLCRLRHRENVEVAVKRLHGSGIDANQQRGFLLEARIMVALNHPHIVAVVGLCTRDRPFAIAMELLPMGDLRSYLQRWAEHRRPPRLQDTLTDDDGGDKEMLSSAAAAPLAISSTGSRLFRRLTSTRQHREPQRRGQSSRRRRRSSLGVSVSAASPSLASSTRLGDSDLRSSMVVVEMGASLGHALTNVNTYRGSDEVEIAAPALESSGAGTANGMNGAGNRAASTSGRPSGVAATNSEVVQGRRISQPDFQPSKRPVLNVDTSDSMLLPNTAQPPPSLLLSTCCRLASAMAYLENLGVVHRDLAARNALVGAAGLPQVKLSDFGMSRTLSESDYYRKTQNEKVPIKWQAPESTRYKTYSSKSDVWSFGVLMYEVFSLGQVPYKDLTAMETALAVAAGRRLEQPPLCPDAVYSVMQLTWAAVPTSRPSFSVLERDLNRIADIGVDDGGLSAPVQGPEDRGPLSTAAALETAAGPLAERNDVGEAGDGVSTAAASHILAPPTVAPSELQELSPTGGAVQGPAAAVPAASVSLASVGAASGLPSSLVDNAMAPSRESAAAVDLETAKDTNPGAAHMPSEPAQHYRSDSTSSGGVLPPRLSPSLARAAIARLREEQQQQHQPGGRSRGNSLDVPRQGSFDGQNARADNVRWARHSSATDLLAAPGLSPLARGSSYEHDGQNSIFAARRAAQQSVLSTHSSASPYSWLRRLLGATGADGHEVSGASDLQAAPPPVAPRPLSTMKTSSLQSEDGDHHDSSNDSGEVNEHDEAGEDMGLIRKMDSSVAHDYQYLDSAVMSGALEQTARAEQAADLSTPGEVARESFSEDATDANVIGPLSEAAQQAHHRPRIPIRITSMSSDAVCFSQADQESDVSQGSSSAVPDMHGRARGRRASISLPATEEEDDAAGEERASAGSLPVATAATAPSLELDQTEEAEESDWEATLTALQLQAVDDGQQLSQQPSLNTDTKLALRETEL